MTKVRFLQAVQSRAARVAISPSTVRGRGNAGVVAAARRFLRSLNLSRFALRNAEKFASELDSVTAILRAALPRKARYWELARKILNVFLRDCLYTTYLAEEYHLQRAETLLELPLDSITAGQLRRAAGSDGLPRWPGVRHLTPATSARFQAIAAKEAKRRNIARVHLDALWWSIGRDANGAYPRATAVRHSKSATEDSEKRRTSAQHSIII
jgi:hypothetical protein